MGVLLEGVGKCEREEEEKNGKEKRREKTE